MRYAARRGGIGAVSLNAIGKEMGFDPALLFATEVDALLDELGTGGRATAEGIDMPPRP